jgi:2-C-methyl-D-erythritol 4-phosphate cytidylyltransferase
VASNALKGIAVLVKSGEEQEAKELLMKEAPKLEHFVGLGGETRQESVYAGLKLLQGKADFVLVHDGARPFCSPAAIAKVAQAAQSSGAAILATPVKQSIKEINDENLIVRSFERAKIWEAQTPQAFRYSVLRDAHESARKDGVEATDDSQLVERLGEAVQVVPGEDKNIKITTPVDLALARMLLDAEQ